MGPNVYVRNSYSGDPRYVHNSYSGHPLIAVLGSSNRQVSGLYVYAATGPGTAAATRATYDFLVRLLATIKDIVASIDSWNDSSLHVSGPALSRFFQESQDNLREFTLEAVILNKEQIHALATESRPQMEVIMERCKLLLGPDCRAAFIEYLHRDRGPIQLDGCKIDFHVIAAALEGNSRVTRLRLSSDMATSNAEKGLLFRSLAENKGLVKLDLNRRPINDENWTILCQSLKTHPTLTTLDLRGTGMMVIDLIIELLNGEQKAERTHVLAAMVRENRVLHTLCLNRNERDEQIYVESILPRLETNLYKPRVLGIKKADIALRRLLLGLALQTESVRSKSNLIWMFLSGNQGVVLQSDEESAAVLQSDEESLHILSTFIYVREN
jgi:hypothetical protein